MKKNLIEFSERVSATFLYAFVGVVIAAGGFDLLALKAGAIAGGLSVSKYIYTLTGKYLAAENVATVVKALNASSTPPQP